LTKGGKKGRGVFHKWGRQGEEERRTGGGGGEATPSIGENKKKGGKNVSPSPRSV